MQKINHLLHQEMTRKEFLATIGFGVATVLGLSTMLRLITGKDNNPFQQRNTLGYGKGTYGGQQ